MKIVRFKSIHKDLYNKWHEGRGLDTSLGSTLPAIGYVVFNHSHPVAMAFARRCEGGLIICEGLVTNPEASPIDRNDGINLILKRLAKLMNRLGYASALMYTVDNHTLMRALEFGCTHLPYYFLSTNLPLQSKD